MAERTNRKVRIGTVVSNKADKTAVVNVQRQIIDEKYGKITRLRKKYYAHDANNECQIGDTVKIMETRPLSKLKRWRICEVLQKTK